MQQERGESEQQLSFERKRIEEMETQIKVLTRINEDAVANSNHGSSGNNQNSNNMSLTNDNHPEVL